MSIPTSFGQTPLDTLYYVDGKIETVQLTIITDNEVHYNYIGEEISIITPKNKF